MSLSTTVPLLFAFHQKLILPTMSMAVGIGIAGYFMLWSTPILEGTGYGYIASGPLMHYIIYDVLHPGEYYFYFNARLNRLGLYLSTIVLNIIIGASILSYA
jgi:hypothetical protein